MTDTTRSFTTRSGRTLTLGAYGLGTAPLGNMHRPVTDDEAAATLAAALVSGIRYFDTAPLYGHGLAEIRLACALSGEVGLVVSTKAGRLLEPCAAGEEDSGIYKATPQLRVRFDYSYDGIMRSYEASLARLQRDRIDILYVHDVDASTHGSAARSGARIRELVDEGGWRALSELRSGGAVAAIGAGVNEWQACARLLDCTDPDLFLLAGRYTLLEQGALGLLNACVRLGVGVVIGGALNSGVLAGRSTYDYGEAPAEIVARVRALDRICRAHDVPLAAAALQFPRAHKAVACVLFGAQTANEVHANANFVATKIPAGLWQDLRAQGLLDPETPFPAN